MDSVPSCRLRATSTAPRFFFSGGGGAPAAASESDPMALFGSTSGLGLSPVLGPGSDGNPSIISNNSSSGDGGMSSSPAPPGYSSVPSIPAIGEDMGGAARKANSSSSTKPVGSGSRHSSLDDQTPTTSVIAGQQPTAIPFAPPSRPPQFPAGGGLQQGGFGGIGPASMMGRMGWQAQMPPSMHQFDPQHNDVQLQQQFFQQQQQIQNEIRVQQEQIQQLQAQLKNQMQQMMIQSGSAGGGGC